MLKELYNYLLESPVGGMTRGKIRSVISNDVSYTYKCGGRNVVAVSLGVTFNKDGVFTKQNLLHLISCLEIDEVSVHFITKNISIGESVSSISQYQPTSPMGILVSEVEAKLVEASVSKDQFSTDSKVIIVATEEIMSDRLAKFVAEAEKVGLTLSNRTGVETEATIGSLQSIILGEGRLSNSTKYGEVGIVTNEGKRDVIRLEFNSSNIPLNAPSCDDLFRNEFVLNTQFYFYKNEDGPVLRNSSSLNIYQDELNSTQIDRLQFLFESLKSVAPDFEVVQNSVCKWYSSIPGNPISFGFFHSLYYLLNASNNFNEAVIYQSKEHRIEDVVTKTVNGNFVIEDLLGGVNSYSFSGQKVFITGERSNYIESLLIPIIEHSLADKERVIVCSSPEESNLSMSFFTLGASVITSKTLLNGMIAEGNLFDLLGTTFKFNLNVSSSEVYTSYAAEFKEPLLGSNPIMGFGHSELQFMNTGGVGAAILALAEARNHILKRMGSVAVIITDPSILYDRDHGELVIQNINQLTSLGGTVFIGNELYHSLVSGGYDEVFLKESLIIGLFEGEDHDSGDVRNKLSRPNAAEGWQECFIQKGDQIAFGRLPFCGRIKFLSNCRHSDALLIGGYVDNGYSFERALIKQIGDFDV